jgi:hypothetical protein
MSADTERPTLDYATPTQSRGISRQRVLYCVSLSLIGAAAGGGLMWDSHLLTSLIAMLGGLLLGMALPVQP